MPRIIESTVDIFNIHDVYYCRMSNTRLCRCVHIWLKKQSKFKNHTDMCHIIIYEYKLRDNANVCRDKFIKKKNSRS